MIQKTLSTWTWPTGIRIIFLLLLETGREEHSPVVDGSRCGGGRWMGKGGCGEGDNCLVWINENQTPVPIPVPLALLAMVCSMCRGIKKIISI